MLKHVEDIMYDKEGFARSHGKALGLGRFIT